MYVNVVLLLKLYAWENVNKNTPQNSLASQADVLFLFICSFVNVLMK